MFYINIEETSARIIVLCIGDSITWGRDTNGGYRLPLQNLLTEAGIAFDFVGPIRENSSGMADPEHAGYSGRTIEEVGTHIEEVPLVPAPDYVLVDVGSNDLYDQVDLPNINNRLDTFINDLRSRWPNTEVLVATIGPFTDSLNPVHTQMMIDVVDYNDHIRSLGAPSVEMAAALNASLQQDGIHPNAAGYAVMASLWFQAITAP